MTLDEIRAQINEVDDQLLPLFLRRMELAERVAEAKKEQGLPVLNPAREKEILDRISARAGEASGEARILFSGLMDMSRARQHKLLGSGRALREALAGAEAVPHTAGTVACLGREGSFSYETATLLFPEAKKLSHESFAAIFASVESGEADFAVLPVENSSAGSVGEVYDLILKYRFFIVRAMTLHIHLCLAASQGASLSTITTVQSHPQPIAQCSNLIAEHGLRAVSCSSTAAAARRVAEEKDTAQATLCSPAAAEKCGLRILARDVQNSQNNCTRFIVISRSLCVPQDANKITLCFALQHTTGTLYSVLSRFAAEGMNLTKIESRPIAGKTFEYDFYLDFSGNLRENHTLELLAALSDELPRFSFLGNYSDNTEI